MAHVNIPKKRVQDKCLETKARHLNSHDFMQRSSRGHNGHFQLVIKKVFGVVEHVAGIQKEAGVLFPGLKALMQIDTGRDHVANLKKIRINKAVRVQKN